MTARTHPTPDVDGATPVGSLLIVEDIAAALKVHPDTVGDWLRSGQLRGFKLARRWRVDPADLAAFLDDTRRADRGAA